MNRRVPISPDEIDGLVRSALAADAQTVDIASMESAINARRLCTRQNHRSHRILVLVKWVAAAAIMIAVPSAVTSFLLSTPNFASAHAIVTSAHSALLKDLDRCYQVELVKLPRNWSRGRAFIQMGDKATVWTRGDRFRVQVARSDQELVWGQDESKRVWGVVDSKRGLLFEQDEVPPKISEALFLFQLDARRLTEEVLRDYDLVVEASTLGRKAVRATRKRRSPVAMGIGSVWMEIDEKTNAILQLEVSRTMRKAEIMKIRFTLIEENRLDNEEYQLAKNLDSDAEVFARDKGQVRAKLLKQLTRD
jgi:hypothetical protein